MTACFNRLRPMHRKTTVFTDYRHLHRGEELNKHYMKVVVLLTAKICTVVLWDKTLYSVTDTYQRLG
jgi:hypothetical protein